MLFKSNNEYDPADAGCDDAHEAVADAAPVSAARRRLAKLLLERDEAQGEMQKARDAIERLQAAASGPSAIEREIGALDLAEGSLISAWSSEGGDFPKLDSDRRRVLEESLKKARDAASACARELPNREASYLRQSNTVAGISHAVGAAIASIILEEVRPAFAAIVETKASLAIAIARAEHGRERALSIIEAIPRDRRFAVAPQFYSELEAVDRTRALAIANPAPSYDRGPWARLVADLATDATATVGGEG
jgi:hypothetical protein